MPPSPDIQLVSLRPTIEVCLPDGRVLSGPRGAPVGDYLHTLDEFDSRPLVGAIVNEELRELTYKLTADSDIRPVTMGEPDGMRIYRRSLTFLLEAAFEEIFEGGILSIDHSVSSGGYFCRVTDRPQFLPAELGILEAKMREFVKANLPLNRVEVPLDDAVEYFKTKKHLDKVRLLAHRKKAHLVLYNLGEYQDYHHGYMVPSTGYLRWFALSSAEGGFILRFPRRHQPTTLLPVPAQSVLLGTFQQYGNWLGRLGISSVGALNDSIQDDRVREVILVSEALHEQRIAEITAEIASHRDRIRVVLIAGPSSSGKTTFSKRLSIQLLARGISPFPLEMDRFFVDRIKSPLDENGEYNFEHLDAVNRTRLNHDLKRLIKGERVRLPRYDFLKGISAEGNEVKLEPEQIVILEGIHGLNPDLIPEIPSEQIFRIYVSALTQLNLDRHNRVSTTDTRLVRRIVRDARERGYLPQETIHRWDSVRRGEKQFIFPYQNHADMMFNSALVYELAVLKPMAEPLLRQVPFRTPERIEAKRLMVLLEWFLQLEKEWIPDNSLLREFIGGSILKDFILWKP